MILALPDRTKNAIIGQQRMHKGLYKDLHNGRLRVLHAYILDFIDDHSLSMPFGIIWKYLPPIGDILTL